MIYVVLGMHKSGTTLVSRALHESGIMMGQEFPAEADYSEVKYEAHWAQEISDNILGLSRKCFSLNVTTKSLPSAGVKKSSLDAIRKICSVLNSKYKDWGFKDPRTALTYRYWKEALPEHRVIYIYRDPIEIWRRYARVNRKWWSRKAFTVWFDYNKSILNTVPVEDTSKCLILKFEGLLSSASEWQRLEKFVERDLVDVRNQNQSKFRVSDDHRGMLKYKAMQWLSGKSVILMYKNLESLRQRQLV